MAIKGLSKPICADYSHDGNGVVTYSNAYYANHAVEYSAEFETGDDNNHYADNKVQERAAGTFSTGDLALTTSDLEPPLRVKLFGLKTATRTVGETTYQEIVHDDSAKAPYVGFGIIEEHQVDDVTLYNPIWFPKVQFKDPNLAGTTREDEIDWQTIETAGTILRSDESSEDYNHPWQISPQAYMTSEKEAEDYLFAIAGGRPAGE